ncbi:MAG: DUF1036 domain-containing protein [Alphaproteobacteria bacterium]|nr:DUF1036 domain-containing protein [Alphaproteobacteria bacterium]
MARARLFNRLAAFGAVGAVAFVLIALALPATAQNRGREREQAGWSLCNETSYVLEAATGRPDGRSILVQGWVRLRPGECKLAVAAPLTRGTHYLFARTSTAHRGGRRQWGGDAQLCVDPSRSFTFDNPPRCDPMSLESRGFRRVQINKRDSWRTSFAEAEPYTLYRARAAGIQRLLADAGFDTSGSRGGVDPRRTAAAIAQFRTTARLQQNASEDQMIDALETAARRRADQVGLTLCNRTSGRVWTAIARRRGEGWESRGWWPLGPGGCARTIDEPLVREVYYILATMETPEGERFLSAPGEPFCASPARFAIIGRENCDGRLYDTYNYAPISSGGRQGLVVEFLNRDFLPVGERGRSLSDRLPRDESEEPPTPRGVRRPPPPASAGSGDT